MNKARLLLVLVPLCLSACNETPDYDEGFYNAVSGQIRRDFNKEVRGMQAEKPPQPVETAAPVPAGFAPWWQQSVSQPLLSDGKPARESLESLYNKALLHSSDIRVFSDIPLIRQTGIREAKGRFDPHIFATSYFENTNEPIGQINTGVFNDVGWQDKTVAEGGIRQKLETGADWKLIQNFTRYKNNNVFFEPNPQDWAQLTLAINQPVLRGGGVEYNTSQIRIAKIDSQVARREFVRQTEAHLVEIARAYWALYEARGTYLQKQRLVTFARNIVKDLEARKDVDAVKSELSRANSSLSQRQAEMVRAEMTIRNLQDRIAALTNDPSFCGGSRLEMLPQDQPMMEACPVDMKNTALVALENRPEIAQAFLQLKAAVVRARVQKNELLPQLDFFVEGWVKGLDSGGFFGGYDNQWNHWSIRAGATFDYPLGNNEAEARYERRRLEVRQQVNQITSTISTVIMEVRMAARDVRTAHQEIAYRNQALKAAKDDLDAIESRRKVHAGEQGYGSALLNLLLDSEDRYAEAEQALIRSIAEYNVALINLQRAKGTLLKYEDVKIVRTVDKSKLPQLSLERAPKSTSQPAAAPAPKVSKAAK